MLEESYSLVVFVCGQETVNLNAPITNSYFYLNDTFGAAYEDQLYATIQTWFEITHAPSLNTQCNDKTAATYSLWNDAAATQPWT